jgi:DNA-binding MarR family transcriptional regulator
MAMLDVRKQFKDVWYRLDNLIGQYAKQAGVSVTTLFVLELLLESDEPPTQKILCEKLFLPKQFVNSIIKSLWEAEYVELKEARDRRNKKVILTPKGNAYAHQILDPFNRADEQAWSGFSDEELMSFNEALVKYERAMDEWLQAKFPPA